VPLGVIVRSNPQPVAYIGFIMHFEISIIYRELVLIKTKILKRLRNKFYLDSAQVLILMIELKLD